MIAPLDISGTRYGRLVAISRAPNDGRRTQWLFRCDCGAEVIRKLEPVRGGITRSCGCLLAETTRKRSLVHGHSIGYRRSRTLRSWYAAKERCFNPNTERYPHYGGRGITMCQEWADSFPAFLRDMGECPSDKTLDRIDVDGHYEPRNCRWATSRQQARTRSDNVLVTHHGMVMVLKDFASLMGVNYKRLHARVKYKGQTPHEAAAFLLR